MLRVLLVIAIWVMFTVLRVSGARSAAACFTRIKHNHCVIEYASKDRIAHVEKYTYNTLFRDCKVLRWSTALCPLPTGDVNIFDDRDTCLQNCSGHA